ncbi:Crp/Fnr family transcriptional regulator [Anaerorhabdus furcosa]|uniref:CRP/FNR family transcriptional regulator, anaerobic regulatory protein n=1 Tax=Anaerorhabdus furcosa TaxID=118967 RepID=A0A1T4LLM6_9FIRM|nr:Crp/Fnr family transcriptional regulator [Anaerorhabdus furcosa]SJZ55487.1 CRP/FNR family transcriptional regulator, anaerobic regulatory protein [Anaerorhabdus furcosa]
MEQIKLQHIIEDTIPAWTNLSNHEKEYLLNNSIEVGYKAHQTIHGEQDSCLGVLIIEEGDLRIYMLSEEGREITLYRLSKGDVCILSASCILSSISFDVFIDTETNVTGILINTEAFSKLMDKNIYLENYVYKLTTERFSDVMWAMQQVLFMSMDKRLAIFLLDEMNRSKTDCIEVTHETIAKYIGSAREVVSRMLKYFEKEGIVELNRGGILVTNKKKLKDLINEG